MPYKKADINQPSTSKAHKEFTSPISPTGRIAKRNARLMNGNFCVRLFLKIISEVDLNSKRSSKYTEAVVNTIMDLKSSDLNEICPIIKIILENEDLSSEDLVGFFVDI